jgi:hypothetical protein
MAINHVFIVDGSLRFLVHYCVLVLWVILGAKHHQVVH